MWIGRALKTPWVRGSMMRWVGVREKEVEGLAGNHKSFELTDDSDDDAGW